MSLDDALGYLPAAIAFVKTGVLPTVSAPSADLPVTALPTSSGIAYSGDYNQAPKGSFSLIRLRGPLIKEYAYYGTAYLREQLQLAEQHDHIDGHILLVDSPGGHVDGTKDLADAVKATKKPVVAYVDGLAASAAMWISSAADEIILSNDTTMVGSVGTMISLMDIRGFLEKQGVKFHEVFAEASNEKNGAYLELLKGNYTPIQQETLNPLNNIFIAAIKENLPGVSEKALHGKMFLAADAIANGLAHSIGNFEYALKRIKILTENGKGKTEDGPYPSSILPSPSSPQTMFTKNKFPQLLVLGTAEAITPEALEAANQELEANGLTSVTLVEDAELEAAEANSIQQDAKIASLTQELAQAKAELAQMTTDKEAAEKQAEQYGSQPGAVATQVTESTELDEDAEQQARIDNLPHNKKIDEFTLNQN